MVPLGSWIFALIASKLEASLSGEIVVAQEAASMARIAIYLVIMVFLYLIGLSELDL